MVEGITLTLALLQDAGSSGGILTMIAPMVLIFGIFYLLVIRPQQKKQRLAQTERDKMLGSLRPGDKVVTSGGMFGTIVSVRDDRVQMKIAQSVSVEMQRSAIAGLQSAEMKETDAAK